MADEDALLMAIPLRHLTSAVAQAPGTLVLPAGGPGHLDAAQAGLSLFLIATEAGDAEVPAATWRATLLRRLPYEPGSPWPEGLPLTWVEEHPLVAIPAAPPPPSGDVEDDEEYEDDEEHEEYDDEDDVGPQSFLEVAQLHELPRHEWLFTNELVRKQARRGRSFRPRVPTLVVLPD